MYHDLTRAVLTPSVIERLERRIPVGADDECWEWTGGRMPAGYGHISVYDPSLARRRHEYAHRLAAMIAYDSDIPAGMHVMHTCDNPPCCNPRHLRIATAAENMQDRDRKRRGRSKSSARKSKKIRLRKSDLHGPFLRHFFSLGIADIERAAELYNSGESIRAVAEQIGVSTLTLCKEMQRYGVERLSKVRRAELTGRDST